MLQLESSGVVKESPRTTRWASTNSTLPVRGKIRTGLFNLRDTNLRFSMEMLVKREAREMQRARASYRWRLTSYTQRIPLNSLSVPIPHKQLTTPMNCETRRHQSNLILSTKWEGKISWMSLSAPFVTTFFRIFQLDKLV